MPYTVEKQGDEYCVVRSGNSSQKKRTLGCYDTKAEAERERQKAQTEGATALASVAATNGTREWFRFVTNKAQIPEIHIYGDIGTTFFDDEGVSATDFIDELNAIDAKQLAVRINSLGGSAWDGLTIAQAIVRHPAQVTTYIDGVAASAASLVAVAGDKVVASKYGQAMLHNASALVMGTAKDMRETAAQLDNLNASLAAFYADRAGGDVAAWMRAMNRETWYNADEMLSSGLATEIDTSAVREEVEAAVARAMQGTAERFQYPGRAAAPTPKLADTPPKEGRMADKKSIAESLGLPDDASDDDILAAARKALGVDEKPPEGDPANPPIPDLTKDTPPAPPAGADPVPGSAPAEVTPAVVAAGPGTVELDAAAYANLKQQAAMGAEAHKTLQAQAHAGIVDKAIDEGRVPLARRGHYLNLMRSDPTDTLDLLTNRLQPGAAVPLTELGHSADANPAASVKEDPRYKAWKVS